MTRTCLLILESKVRHLDGSVGGRYPTDSFESGVGLPTNLHATHLSSALPQTELSPHHSHCRGRSPAQSRRPFLTQSLTPDQKPSQPAIIDAGIPAPSPSLHLSTSTTAATASWRLVGQVPIDLSAGRRQGEEMNGFLRDANRPVHACMMHVRASVMGDPGAEVSRGEARPIESPRVAPYPRLDFLHYLSSPPDSIT